ncbi:SH3 domain-binding protein 5-like [Argonauta hians]
MTTSTLYNNNRKHGWDVDYDDDDVLNCRIKIELNRLNEASEEINRLENDLDKARSAYQSTLSNRTHELDQLSAHIRKSISKSKDYYEQKEISKCVQEETLRAARHFQTANSIYQAAKETILLAEAQLMQENSDHCHTSELSSSTQEALNHAIIRLMEAEKEKRKREEEHHRTASICSELEMTIKKYERLHTKAIAKSKPYFEKKNEMKEALRIQKKQVDSLQSALLDMKGIYSEALKNLEQISEEVHRRRKLKEFLYLPREPGVGSEWNELHNKSEFEPEEKPINRSSPKQLGDNNDDDNDDKENNNNNNNCKSNISNNEHNVTIIINNSSNNKSNSNGIHKAAVAVAAFSDDGSSSSESNFGDDRSPSPAVTTSADEEYVTTAVPAVISPTAVTTTTTTTAADTATEMQATISRTTVEGIEAASSSTTSSTTSSTSSSTSSSSSSSPIPSSSPSSSLSTSTSSLSSYAEEDEVVSGGIELVKPEFSGSD